MSEGKSIRTVDPRSLAKAKLEEEDMRDSAMRSEAPRYSILAKKRSVEEIFSRDTLKIKKMRSQQIQPRQQFLIKDDKLRDLAMYMHQPRYLNQGKYRANPSLNRPKHQNNPKKFNQLTTSPTHYNFQGIQSSRPHTARQPTERRIAQPFYAGENFERCLVEASHTKPSEAGCPNQEFGFEFKPKMNGDTSFRKDWE